MKGKRFALLLAVVLAWAALPGGWVRTATAAEYVVTVDPVTGEMKGLDPAFEAAVLETTTMASLTVQEAAKIKRLNVNSKGITSLAGIEYFTNLAELECNSNRLTELDVSKNTALTTLRCNSTQLTELDVSKNTALTVLICRNNQLTELDVSRNTALTELDPGINKLTALDVSKNTELTRLSVYSNQLTTLDVSENNALTSLTVDNNQLTTLDVSKNTALESLGVDHNRLTALDVTNNTALRALHVYNNQLTALNVSKNTALTALWCYDNQLTALDVSNNTALTSLYCFDNQLTALDVSKNTALAQLRCYENHMSSPDDVLGWQTCFDKAEDFNEWLDEFGGVGSGKNGFAFYPQSDPSVTPPPVTPPVVTPPVVTPPVVTPPVVTPTPPPTTNPGGNNGNGGNSNGNSGGSSVNSGGSTANNTVVSAPATDSNVSSVFVDTADRQPGEPVLAVVSLTAKESNKGVVSFNIKKSTLTDAIKEAKAALKELPKDERASGATVTIAIDHSENATSVKAKLDNSALKMLTAANMGLVVESPLFSVELNAAALQEIVGSVTANLSLDIKPVTRLTGEAKVIIGDYPVFDFSLKAGSKVVTLTEGVASLSIPFTLGGTMELLAVVEVSGNPQEVRYLDESDYSLENGWLTWTGSPNGVYGIAPR